MWWPRLERASTQSNDCATLRFGILLFSFDVFEFRDFVDILFSLLKLEHLATSAIKPMESFLKNDILSIIVRNQRESLKRLVL